MKCFLIRLCAIVLLFAFTMPIAANDEYHDGYMVIEGGTTVTMGSFSYQDYTADMSTEFFNPTLSVEYVFKDSKFSIGILYSSINNHFDMKYRSSNKSIDAELDADRTELQPFIRLGRHDRHNIRLSYRMFNYEFSDGYWIEYVDGNLKNHARDGKATGKLSNGVDAEMNLFFGNRIQLHLQLGVSYFFNAEYDWEYYDLIKNRIDSGDAKLDALSVRLAPGISFMVMDNLRISANYLMQGTSWLGSKDDEDKEYAGADIVSGVVLKAKYIFNF